MNCHWKLSILIGFRAFDYFVTGDRHEIERYLATVVPRSSFQLTEADNVATGTVELSQLLIRDGIA